VSAISTSASPEKPRALAAILWGGVIAGAFDLTYATVFYSFRGVKPIRVSQSIASGLLGPKAYEGGVATAILGVVLHFVIAMGAATVFYLVSRKLTFLTQKPILGVHCMALRSIFSCISWYCRWRRIRDSEPRRFRSPRFLTPSEWRKPWTLGRGKPRLQRRGLLFDVAFDCIERRAAAGCGEVRRRPQYILPVALGDARQLATENVTRYPF